MEFKTDTLKNSPNEPGMTVLHAAFTSSLVAVVATVSSTGRPRRRKQTYVSRQSPNSRRRQRTSQSPAEFKRVIDEKYGTQFYITSLDGRVAQIYPFEEWERIEQKLASLSTFNPTKKKFLARVNYWGQQVEMDGQGRLLIPQLLREKALIKGEVAVLGNLTYLEVRNLQALQTEIETEQFTTDDEKTLDELGI